ncbi:GIY-YIG nuclease family protein [Sulfitobacter sp. EhC04]|uniref:GIY-YIG nuclease family protein n=1 Tax=Sulfitobacter sp. EhC04 TaxID=1849168 RepID=UPI00137316FE|nr:GIY-YIG nuclease family protein [Sulfitobacter sp. EhC04]
MLIMRKSDVVRRMRPYQEKLAQLMIDDICDGKLPTTIKEIQNRYRDHIGPELRFETNRGWNGDIRDAAIWTLVKNGFAKMGAVQLATETPDGHQTLEKWKVSREELHIAAQIEISYGGNRKTFARWTESARHTQVHYAGSGAVYVYTDSRLDHLGDVCTKIGRHEYSGIGNVRTRILQQYGTSTPGIPILWHIFRTDREKDLENHLHRKFSKMRITGGFGSEWFQVSPDEVFSAVRDAAEDWGLTSADGND